MKRTDSQSGSAHVIVIVLLIVVILGLLGYVAYTQLMKKTTATSTQPTTSQQSATTEQPVATTKDLTFGDWGVKVTVANDSTLYVKKDTSTDINAFDGYFVYDTAFDKLCGDGAGVDSIASVTRVKASDTVDPYVSDQGGTNRAYYTQNPNQGRIIGDYVYVYGKPNGQYGCTVQDTTAGQQAGDAQGTASGSFYQAFLKMQAE